MEYIRKSIYSRPEIRHALLPLWTAWALTAVGAVCGVAMCIYKGNSAGLSSALLGGVIVGCQFYYAFERCAATPFRQRDFKVLNRLFPGIVIDAGEELVVVDAFAGVVDD